jgi:pimeloyl-ACP methyl ester carboxylesterase
VRRSALLILAAAVLVAGCTSVEGVVGAGTAPRPADPTTTTAPTTTAPAVTTPASTAPPAASSLTWTPCGQYECSTLQVPLDHAQPGGRKISIALNRRRASDQSRRIGSLLLNPGGPGASGVDALPDLLSRVSNELKARFDVVGFDPRGTGKSSPVKCLPNAELDRYFATDPTPEDAAEKAALVQSVERFVAGCKQRSGDLLPHVGTEDAARDMDLIRAAVGDEKLTYIGFSYGTALGASYAELFPGRVRALLLDGAVDPSLDTPRLNRVQGMGFDGAFDAFAADCRAKAACAWKPAGGATKAAFIALAAKVDSQPIPAGSRRVAQAEMYLGVATFLYSQQTWTVLARALAQAEGGSGVLVLLGFDTLLGREPDGSYKNDQEANAAINCLDNPAPKDVAAYERAAAEAAGTAPAFGPVLAWSGLVCALWPVPATGKAAPIRAPGSPPILVVGTTNDPSTPFVWAEALASQLEKGRLLRHEGEGHTAYGEDTCTTRIADAYLLTLQLPPGDLRC